jgi:hypothetical protein
MRTILVLATILIPTLVHAQQVGVVVTSEASVQPQLAAQLESWLHDHGRHVVAGALDADATNTLIDCFVLEDLNCARAVVDKRGKSKALVFARAEITPNDDGTRDIAITAHWFQKSHDVLAERVVCPRCNDQLLTAAVDEVMSALVHEPPLALAPPEPSPRPAPPPDPSLEPRDPAAQTSPRAMLPIALVAVGGVGLVAGGVMIAIDQDPDRNGVQTATYRDTATAGVVLGVAGAAAVGAGVYLWLTHKPSSAPVAAVSHDAAYIGWAGRF